MSLQVLAPKYKNLEVFENQIKNGKRIEVTDKKTGEVKHAFNEYVGGQSMELSESYKQGEALSLGRGGAMQLMEQVNTSDLLNHVSLREAAMTTEFPSQLREDFRVIMLAGFQEVQDVLLPLFYTAQSTKKEETYAGINKMPQTDGVVREKVGYWILGTSPKTDVTIRNYKRGGIVEVTEEMIMFDKSAELSRLATELGMSVKYERYQLNTDVLTADGNTTAASATVLLTATNLENLMTTFQTQSDAASGKKLMFTADTLVVPAAKQWTARRILESVGVPGSAANDPNVMRGIVNLVVCPLLDDSSTTRFYLGKARHVNGLIYQNVIGPNPETFTLDAHKADDGFIYDLIKYKSRLYYGQGIIDIRYWHRSTT